VDEVYANGSHYRSVSIRNEISQLMCHEAQEIRGSQYYYHDLDRVARGHYRLAES
jgi:hypothetical protein